MKLSANYVRATAGRLTASEGKREIEGLVVPFNEIGYASIDGEPRELLFEPGGLAWETVGIPLVVDHSESVHTFAGRAVSLDDTDAGVYGVFKAASTTAGTDAIVEAAEDFRAGLSIEADIPDPIPPTGVVVVTAANPGVLRRVALVETPAFAMAKVHKAAAAEVKAAPATGAPAPAHNASAAEVADDQLSKVVTAITDATSSLTEAAATLTSAVQPPAPPADAAPAADPAAPAAASYMPPRNPATRAGGNPVVTATQHLPTPGEYMRAFCSAALENDPTALHQMRAEINKVDGTRHVWGADQKIADTAGLVPTHIIGDVVSNIDASRPIIQGVTGPLTMPAAGSTFKRPRITQHATVATQSAEMDALSSQKMTVAGDTVTKVSKGGYVTLSEQDIDWTDPAALDLLLADLANVYAIDVDNYVADYLVATETGSTQAAALDSTADLFITGLATAAATSYAASGVLPDTLYVTPAVWASIVSLDDADKRPIFPNAGPVNAPGTMNGVTTFEGNPMNLNLVVDANFASGTAIIGPKSKFEFYEQNKGHAQIAAPSTMGVTCAYRGYIAAYLAAPAAFIDLDVTV